MRERDLLGLVGEIYTAATAPARWPAVLEAISDRHDGAAVLMGRINRDAYCDNLIGCRWPAESVAAFRREFGLVNPGAFIRALPGIGIAQPVTPEDIEGEGSYAASPQYNLVGRHFGFRHWITAVLYREPGWASFLNLARPAGKRPFNTNERVQLALLSQHLGRAVALQHTLAASHATGRLLGDIVDRFDRGAVVVDASGRIQFANRMARAIFANGDGLTAVGDRLRTRSAGETALLLELIAEAAATSAGEAVAASGPLRVSRHDGARAYALVVSPLSPSMLAGIDDRAVALVLIADPDRRLPTQRHLTTMHGFTPAEGRLATRLMLDETAVEAARALDVSITTVRFHLRNMLAKTGVRRQAEMLLVLRATQ